MSDFNEAKLSIKIDEVEQAEENDYKEQRRLEQLKRQQAKRKQQKQEYIDSFGLKRKYND